MKWIILIAILGAILATWWFVGGPAARQKTRRPMTLESFAEATIQVIREDGIAGYLPTILLNGEIRVIEGIPATVDHRTAIQNVVRRSNLEDNEFLFGVRSADETITLGHFRPGRPTEFMTIARTSAGYATNTLETCDWWKIQ